MQRGARANLAGGALVAMLALGAASAHAQQGPRVGVVLQGDQHDEAALRARLLQVFREQGWRAVETSTLEAARVFIAGSSSQPIDATLAERIRQNLGADAIMVVDVRRQPRGQMAASITTVDRQGQVDRRFTMTTPANRAGDIATLVRQVPLAGGKPEPMVAPPPSPASPATPPPEPATPKPEPTVEPLPPAEPQGQEDDGDATRAPAEPTAPPEQTPSDSGPEGATEEAPSGEAPADEPSAPGKPPLVDGAPPASPQPATPGVGAPYGAPGTGHPAGAVGEEPSEEEREPRVIVLVDQRLYAKGDLDLTPAGDVTSGGQSLVAYSPRLDITARFSELVSAEARWGFAFLAVDIGDNNREFELGNPYLGVRIGPKLLDRDDVDLRLTGGAGIGLPVADVPSGGGGLQAPALAYAAAMNGNWNQFDFLPSVTTLAFPIRFEGSFRALEFAVDLVSAILIPIESGLDTHFLLQPGVTVRAANRNRTIAGGLHIRTSWVTTAAGDNAQVSLEPHLAFGQGFRGEVGILLNLDEPVGFAGPFDVWSLHIALGFAI